MAAPCALPGDRGARDATGTHRPRPPSRRGEAWRRRAHVTLGDPEGASADLLDRLAALDARGARVVEMRVFGGLTVPEIAQVLEVSPRTVDNDWAMARMWLARELSGRDGSGRVTS